MMIHFEVFIAWGPQNQVMFLEEISGTTGKKLGRRAKASGPGF